MIIKKIGTIGYWWVKISDATGWLCVEIAENLNSPDNPSNPDNLIIYIMGHKLDCNYEQFMLDNLNPANWKFIDQPESERSRCLEGVLRKTRKKIKKAWEKPLS